MRTSALPNPRPSSLPMLAQCTQFESGSTDFAEEGTQRHLALHQHFNGDDTLLLTLDEESQDGIKWAAEYIRVHAPISDHPILWEQPVKILYPNFEEVIGHPDCICGAELFDFKWRQRDYTPQLAAYALPQLFNFPRVRAHVLYGQPRYAEKIDFDAAAVDDILSPILNRCEDNKPTPCDYCGWCAKRLTCEALTTPAKHIASRYDDTALQMVENWHPSEMTSAADIALGLTIWRKILKKWGDSMEYHAMEAAVKKGLKLPGFELATKKGRKYVTDTTAAYEASGLKAEEFLKACEATAEHQQEIS
jgi:hypothetical protein